MTVIAAGMDRYTNNFATTLNGGIDNVTTTIVVTSATGSPNPGPFRILIGNEQMQVTGGYGTTSWTVIRGVDGTAAASHSNLDPVTNNITAFDYHSYRSEFNPLSYGAVGDGVADDSISFQNAINDAHALANGAHIYLPSLPFKVNSSLTTYSNVAFFTNGAVISGTGASSVAPLIKFTLLGGLTVPGALVASTGVTVTTGGLTVTAGGLTVSASGITVTGKSTITPVQTTGQIGLTIAPSAVGSVTGETIGIQQSAQTATITSGFTTQRFALLKRPTISAGSALTVTNSATLAIEGAPQVGGSAVITNPWSIWVQQGTSRFDGTLDVNALTQLRGTGLASGGVVLNVTPPAVGTVIAETSNLIVGGNTTTITSGFANQRFTILGQPTISALSGLTVTNAATLAIVGAPTTGGFAVITNPYALWIQAGTAKFDGAIVHSRNAADTIPVTQGTTPTGVQLWIQSSDPGGSANNGDLWFAG